MIDGGIETTRNDHASPYRQPCHNQELGGILNSLKTARVPERVANKFLPESRVPRIPQSPAIDAALVKSVALDFLDEDWERDPAVWPLRTLHCLLNTLCGNL
jgi:hypothetical protein